MEQITLVIRTPEAAKVLIDSYEKQVMQYQEAVADTIKALATMLKEPEKKVLLQMSKNLALRWQIIDAEAWAERAKLTKYEQRASFDYSTDTDKYIEE